MTVSFDDFWDFSILSNLKNFMNSMKNYGQDEIDIIYDIYIIYESVKQIKFIIHIYESSDFFFKDFQTLWSQNSLYSHFKKREKISLWIFHDFWRREGIHHGFCVVFRRMTSFFPRELMSSNS